MKADDSSHPFLPAKRWGQREGSAHPGDGGRTLVGEHNLGDVKPETESGPVEERHVSACAANDQRLFFGIHGQCRPTEGDGSPGFDLDEQQDFSFTGDDVDFAAFAGLEILIEHLTAALQPEPATGNFLAKLADPIFGPFFSSGIPQWHGGAEQPVGAASQPAMEARQGPHGWRDGSG